MICENIKNTKDYTGINPNFKKAFEFIINNNLNELKVGNYEIDGDKVFAFVQQYTTQAAEDKRWESHEKYIDIQYIIDGEEVMGYVPIHSLNECEDLRADKDLIFYNEIEKASSITFSKGDYAIFFPEDGHKPGCALGEGSKVKKIVIKVACK